MKIFPLASLKVPSPLSVYLPVAIEASSFAVSTSAAGTTSVPVPAAPVPAVGTTSVPVPATPVPAVGTTSVPVPATAAC